PDSSPVTKPDSPSSHACSRSERYFDQGKTAAALPAAVSSRPLISEGMSREGSARDCFCQSFHVNDPYDARLSTSSFALRQSLSMSLYKRLACTNASLASLDNRRWRTVAGRLRAQTEAPQLWVMERRSRSVVAPARTLPS